MSGTQNIVVGNKGRIVIPAEVRQRRNWPEGTVLVAVETKRGVILTDRHELEQLVREQLGGGDLVQSLIGDRRKASEAEDAV